MKILGIETSCDETSAAVISVNENKKITLLSNVISSSMSLHSQTGGIIPEVAAREQIKFIIPVINEALSLSSRGGTTRDPHMSAESLGDFSSRHSGIRNDTVNIDAIAVTYGPGLIGSLLVGVETAKTLALTWNKPIIPVNHLFGHIYANWLSPSLPDHEMAKQSQQNEIATPSARDDKIEFPALALVVSGGHTDLVLLNSHENIKWLGGTRDDAAGEAFDKIGRLLNLSYPAGPIIENLAKKGDPKRFRFPRPLMHDQEFDFSFSGLKTAVLREIQRLCHPDQAKHVEGSPSTHLKDNLMQNMFLKSDDKDSSTSLRFARNDKLDEQTICDIAYATQDAIIDVLVHKTLQAAKQYNVTSILLGGGVAANQTLVDTLKQSTLSSLPSAKLFVPTKNLCTDNAAMIATAAVFRNKQIPWHEIKANPELYFD